MNAAPTTAHDDVNVPLPVLTREERDALVLELQRLAARLARAEIISSATATRLMRTMNRERRTAEDRRSAFGQVLLDLLLGIEDGTLKEGLHVVRLEGERIAVHVASAVPALFRAGRWQLPTRELRSLIGFGSRHLRGVVLSRTARARFNSDGDRRRVLVLHEPSAYEFVGARKNAVPFR